MSYTVEAKSIVKKYGSKMVLDDVSFKIKPGTIVGLASPNGSGKTTLIKLIADFLTLDGGEITVDGQKAGPATKAIVSYLPDHELFGGEDKVRTAVKFYNDYHKDFDSEKCRKYLETFKIDENAKIESLSKGTREIFNLILTLSRDAKLYLLDEPLANVDPVNREAIVTTILKEFKEEASVIISTHLLNDVETILDEVLMIKENKLFCHKSVEEIREETGKSLNEFFKETFKVDWFGGDNK
jgi:ABC-2 type transport system ATP-binding protein